jgi:hypothetical protein
VIPLDRVRAMLATATPSPIDVHRCDADGGDIDYQLQRGAGHGGTVLGYASDRDGSPRAKADATLWSHAPDLARDVLTLAAALETAQRERDTARSAHAELASAVREYRDAVDDACIARGSEDAGLDVAFAVAEREDDAARAVDALLAAAPPRSTVPARLVREYLAAEASWREGIGAYLPGEDVTAYVARRDVERARVNELHSALWTALAGCS